MERPREQPVAARTLGDLGDRNQVFAYCDACRQSCQLDLAALRERYGPQLSFNRLAGAVAVLALRRTLDRDVPRLGY